MPLHFAYGSNMDSAAMKLRCPGAKALGAARLMRHRFIIMQEGFASVIRDPQGVVHGVLWDLTLADLRRLDAYEEVARGLYAKAEQPVLKASGGSSRALVYMGRGAPGGSPQAGYMAGVLRAAREWGFSEAYMRELMRLTPHGEQQASGDVAASSPAPKVRPRFASPFDR
ncbi:MAG: gamma-glutamylcyclotransferase family protein [Beijerinckiaceae bacterium]|nr:gamma-glutamylcyclotransferase family protein [Beijerinckiaceae bacterium]